MKRDITKRILYDSKYLDIVYPIINSSEFKRRQDWVHHENVTLGEHLLIVSYMSYLICKKRKLNYRDAAIGGLLHDFYNEPWQDHLYDKIPLLKSHGFVHAREAMENAYKYFPELMNERIANIIERHMFPLTGIPPKYKEGWIITYVDKKVSLDIVLNIKALPKYLGLAKHVRKIKNAFKRK
ncbi:MAG: HD family phosphohydrolase [Bacilli bacterium]|nr:HD family phosphohydrolase [Bacilli bacterium]